MKAEHQTRTLDLRPEDLAELLVLRVERLRRHRELTRVAEEDLDVAGDLLQALPLASADYAAAHNRLRNARRYLQSAEPGAAGFELRLLACQVRFHFRDEAREPRRHLRKKA